VRKRKLSLKLPDRKTIHGREIGQLMLSAGQFYRGITTTEGKLSGKEKRYMKDLANWASIP
jgi:hypothetical protein